MVMIYTCTACLRNKHAKCERGTPMAPGCVSGGSICRCPCHGDPNWNKPSKIERQLRRQLKNIINFATQSNVNKKIPSKKPKNGKD